jgi:hypothetical protein
VRVEPDAVALKFAGAFGAVLQLPTVKLTSVDGPLRTPVAALRIRTKYVPAGTLVAVKLVAVDPVEKFARFDPPDDDPA